MPKTLVEKELTMEIRNPVSCPECGCYAVVAVSEFDEDGLAEYHCEVCGHYFVDQVPEEEHNAGE